MALSTTMFDIYQDEESCEVDNWLDQIGLGRYRGLLRAEGFDDFRIIRGAAKEDIEELITLCGMPRLHAQQFRRALLSLQESQNTVCAEAVDASTHVAGGDDTIKTLDKSEDIERSEPLAQPGSSDAGDETVNIECSALCVESTENGCCEGIEVCETTHDLEDVVDKSSADLEVSTYGKSLSFDSEEGPIWEVVGGRETGGVLVRIAQDLKSAEASPARLTCGSLVRELDLFGTRLNFELVSGCGPKTGWVTTKLPDKDLLIKRSADVHNDSVCETRSDPLDRSQSDVSSSSSEATAAPRRPALQFHQRSLNLKSSKFLDRTRAERDFPELPMPNHSLLDKFGSRKTELALAATSINPGPLMRVTSAGRLIAGGGRQSIGGGVAKWPAKAKSNFSSNIGLGYASISRGSGSKGKGKSNIIGSQ